MHVFDAKPDWWISWAGQEKLKLSGVSFFKLEVQGFCVQHQGENYGEHLSLWNFNRTKWK